MNNTKYAIDGRGKLVYLGTNDTTYTVWGIGEYGLLHGVGFYQKREDCKRFVFDKPDYLEIERYYDNLDKMFGDE